MPGGLFWSFIGWPGDQTLPLVCLNMFGSINLPCSVLSQIRMAYTAPSCHRPVDIVARLEFGYWLFQCFSTLPSVVEIPNWYQINVKHLISSWPHQRWILPMVFWFIHFVVFLLNRYEMSKGAPLNCLQLWWLQAAENIQIGLPETKITVRPLKNGHFSIGKSYSNHSLIFRCDMLISGRVLFWGVSLKVLPGLQVCWEKCPTSNSMPLLWKIAINFLRFECRT